MPGVCRRLETALGQLFPRQIAQRRQAAAAEAADLAAATDRAVASGASASSQASCDISGTWGIEICHGMASASCEVHVPRPCIMRQR